MSRMRKLKGLVTVAQSDNIKRQSLNRCIEGIKGLLMDERKGMDIGR